MWGGRWAIVLTVVGGLLVLHTTAALLGAEPDIEYPGGTFSDDNGNTHEENIEAIAAEGITAGCGEALYCPGDKVTRAQLASFLDRALDPPDTAVDAFGDDNGNTHEDAINRLAAASIAFGCSEGNYCPDDHLTRAQMASLLVRALPDLVDATDDYFADDDGNTHEDNINVLAENAITFGCAENLYCPHDNLPRDQMASLLARALDLDPISPIPIPFQLELVLGGFNGGTTDLQAPAGDDRRLSLRRRESSRSSKMVPCWRTRSSICQATCWSPMKRACSAWHSTQTSERTVSSTSSIPVPSGTVTCTNTRQIQTIRRLPMGHLLVISSRSNSEKHRRPTRAVSCGLALTDISIWRSATAAAWGTPLSTDRTQ